MKDYNLHYYHLRLPLDASQEEVLDAFREEVENMKPYPPVDSEWKPKLRERQLVLEHALEALGHPGNRAMYHDERWKECVFGSSTRDILKAYRMWPLGYVPRRAGPMPDSFEGLSLFKRLRNELIR